MSTSICFNYLLAKFGAVPVNLSDNCLLNGDCEPRLLKGLKDVCRWSINGVAWGLSIAYGFITGFIGGGSVTLNV